MKDSRILAKKEEAAKWFAAIRRGVMPIEERLAYETWRQDPTNAAAFAAIEQAWLVAATVPHPRIESRQTLPSRAATGGFSALIAAMCVVTLGIGAVSLGTGPEFWTALDWTDR